MIIIHAQDDVYITCNRMPAEEKDAAPPEPKVQKQDEPTDECTKNTESGQSAEPPLPVSNSTKAPDLDALLAPLSHSELVELRVRLDDKLPAPPAPAPEAPLQHKVLFVAFLASIVSVDAAAFVNLAAFGSLSFVFGAVIPAFAMFALAPAFLPLALFVFSEPARDAISEAAHEFRNVLALFTGVRNNSAIEKQKAQ